MTLSKAASAKILKDLGAQEYSKIFLIPLGKLQVLPEFNCRMDYGNLVELGTDIKNNGLLVPLRLMIIDGVHYVEDGHRRYFAMLAAELGNDFMVSCYIGEQTSIEDKVASQISTNSGKKFTFIADPDGLPIEFYEK